MLHGFSRFLNRLDFPGFGGWFCNNPFRQQDQLIDTWRYGHRQSFSGLLSRGILIPGKIGQIGKHQ
jgi:hypothetical protein